MVNDALFKVDNTHSQYFPQVVLLLNANAVAILSFCLKYCTSWPTAWYEICKVQMVLTDTALLFFHFGGIKWKNRLSKSICWFFNSNAHGGAAVCVFPVAGFFLSRSAQGVLFSWDSKSIVAIFRDRWRNAAWLLLSTEHEQCGFGRHLKKSDD